MGSGEYAVDANRRLTAGEFQDAGAHYVAPQSGQAISVNYTLHASDALRSFVPSANEPALRQIDPSIRFLHAFGFGLPVLEKSTRIAASTGRAPAEELIRSGAISRTSYAMVTAQHLGVNYSEGGPQPEHITSATHRLTSHQVELLPARPQNDFCDIATTYRGWHNRPGIHIACEPSAGEAIDKLVSHTGIEKSQINLTTRKALHASQFIAGKKLHLKNAIRGLAKTQPDKSASKIITGRQIFFCLTMIALVGGAVMVTPVKALLAIHIVASLFYLAVVFMRAAIIIPGAKILAQKPTPIVKTSAGDRELPIYTIVIALYREAGQVVELASALGKIDWPADRLQILLVCEEDDPETIARCRAYDSDERFQTVVCPVSHPRTKPKALNFALPLAKGEFLVLYDAEDRPHPDQLREAHGVFCAKAEMACLQAPLYIHNDTQSWFTRMFAIEYTTQFSLILPVLEKWHSPIALGGTSNHFRSDVLRKIGAWDPYNVTEDADLGIRLARAGYRCGTIKLPTMEEAPPHFAVWFKQRTRWVKGWIQTFLVHMRHPAKLTAEFGIRKTMLFHLVITAMVLSVLIHPLFVISSIYYGAMLLRGSNIDVFGAAILGIDAFNLVGGYSTYFAIAWVSLEAKNKHYLRKSIIWLPLYWLLISLAGWRAVFQLFYDPFLWEKTRHGLATRPDS